MNRIIKFRVWLSDRKHMLYPTDNLHLVGIDGAVWLRLENWFQDYENRDYCRNGNNVIQQFTGLKDKNGKEIYEGDILKHYPGFGCEWKERISVVEYKECSFWEVHKYKGTGVSFVLSSYDQSLEIIGNIFENPELFKSLCK